MSLASRAPVHKPPLRVTTHRIPSGARGTDRTVEHIRCFILQGTKDFAVRRRAIDVLVARRVSPKDYPGEINALFEWVQRNIRYTRDPFRVELLHSARRMLQLRAGDCDDMTILLGAMLQSVGHPVRIVVVGPDPLRPQLFTHVYPEVRCRGRWIAADATMPHPMGWAPMALVKKVISLRRRQVMRFGAVDGRLGQTTTGPSADLVAAVRSKGVQPRDARVKATWHLLRSRGLLDQDPWVRWLLRRLWESGLPAGYRPRTATRLGTALRGWGLPFRSMSADSFTCHVAPDGRLVAPELGPGGRAWLRELVAAVQQGTLQARDPRVRALWRVLRRRGWTAGSDEAARQMLRDIWRGGTSVGGQPAAARLVQLLENVGLLPRGRPGRRTYRRGPGYPGRPYGRMTPPHGQATPPYGRSTPPRGPAGYSPRPVRTR